jgi:hypothetical protein
MALARLIARGGRIGVEALGGAAAEDVAKDAEAEGEREEDDGGDGRAGVGVEQDNQRRREQEAERQAGDEADGAADVGEVASAQLVDHTPTPQPLP